MCKFDWHIHLSFLSAVFTFTLFISLKTYYSVFVSTFLLMFYDLPFCFFYIFSVTHSSDVLLSTFMFISLFLCNSFIHLMIYDLCLCTSSFLILIDVLWSTFMFLSLFFGYSVIWCFIIYVCISSPGKWSLDRISLDRNCHFSLDRKF